MLPAAFAGGSRSGQIQSFYATVSSPGGQSVVLIPPDRRDGMFIVTDIVVSVNEVWDDDRLEFFDGMNPSATRLMQGKRNAQWMIQFESGLPVDGRTGLGVRAVRYTNSGTIPRAYYVTVSGYWQ